MKTSFYLAFKLIAFSTACRHSDPGPAALPDYVIGGKTMMACKINGVPWVLKARAGNLFYTPDLAYSLGRTPAPDSATYDPNYHYWFLSSGAGQIQVGFYVKDISDTGRFDFS